MGQNVPEMVANFGGGEGHEKEMEGWFTSGKASLEGGCKVFLYVLKEGNITSFT